MNFLLAIYTASTLMVCTGADRPIKHPNGTTLEIHTETAKKCTSRLWAGEGDASTSESSEK
jgi:hypothetical protein